MNLSGCRFVEGREHQVERIQKMARIQLDEILVVDIEATCWEGKVPVGQENEIIEIGVCRLDVQTGERLGKESILIRPERSEVSEFCTQLTTLTQDLLDREGVSFVQACQKLQDGYQSRLRNWASYGNYDQRMFERQCAERRVTYPFGGSHVNVKTLFALQRRMHREVGMARALEMLGLPLEGTHHRGHDDAWNIAGILATLLW